MGKKIVGAIMAGGEGTRLRPLTYYFQKCMIPIGTKQKPLLEYVVHHHIRNGINDLIMLVGYKHEQIENYFGDGGRFGVKIKYILDDPKLIGSGGSVLNAFRNGVFEGYDAILVYYGDILSSIKLSELIDQHVKNEAAATLAVTKGFEVPVGVAQVEEKRVIKWEEKPKIDILAGIGVVALGSESLTLLDKIGKKKSKIDLMGDLIPSLLKNGNKVEAYSTDEYWYDVGSTEKYEKIDNGLIDRLFNF
jgi:mannose-1-phosphate guanylyltransferase